MRENIKKKRGPLRILIRILPLFAFLLLAGVSSAYAALPAADPCDPEYVIRKERGLIGLLPEEISASRDNGGSTDPGVNPYTGNTYVHDSRFTDGEAVDGIDVSKWNGDVDWAKVKADGIEFAMIRIGYSSLADGKLNPDPYFEANYAGAKAQGLRVGIYFYSQAINEAEAKAEAKYAMKLLGGRAIEFPLVFDSERPESGRLAKAKLTQAAYCKVAKAFVDTVEQAGYDSMVYAGKNSLETAYDAPTLENFTEIWLARYVTNKSGYAAAYSGQYSMWQYTSNGKVDGIRTVVDCNFFYPSAFQASAACKVKKLTAKADGSAMVLSWKAVQDAASYEVYRSDSYDGQFGKIGETTETTYRDENPGSCGEYTYQVCPKFESGKEGILSSKVTGVFPLAQTYSVETKASSNLRLRAGTGFAVVTKLAAGTACKVTGTAKSADGTLWYRVSAGNGGKTYTGYMSSKMVRMVVNKVTGVKKKAATKKTITIRWTPQAGVTGYKVYASTALNGKYKLVGTVKDGNTFTHTKLKTSCFYYYKVRAYSRVNKVNTFGKLSSAQGVATTAVSLKVKTRSSSNLRKYAGTGYKKVATVAAGTKMKALYRSMDNHGKWWYYVEYTVKGKTKKGFILRSLVRRY